MYQNDKALEIIREEKINVISFQYTPGGAVKGLYLCTKLGTELDLGNPFVSKYTVDESWDVDSRLKESGCAQKVCEWKITEKETNAVIYEQ